jgi:hypothetical protein
MAAITASILEPYLGKSIAAICSNHYSTPSQNHCAHFVAHALGIKIATLCGDMAWKTRHTGATVRVDELYNGLTYKGPWDQRPGHAVAQLIFVIRKDHVVSNVMQRGVPEKHVGIYLDGAVYNYSNTHHRVVKDDSVDAFHAKFKHEYKGPSVSLFYGAVP